MPQRHKSPLRSNKSNPNPQTLKNVKTTNHTTIASLAKTSMNLKEIKGRLTTRTTDSETNAGSNNVTEKTTTKRARETTIKTNATTMRAIKETTGTSDDFVL